MSNILMTNAPVIFSNLNPNTNINRLQFIVQDEKSLIQKHLVQRTQIHHLPRDISTKIRNIRKKQDVNLFEPRIEQGS